MAGIDLALDVLRDIADAVDIGDRRSAEFHHQTSHQSCSRPFKKLRQSPRRRKKGAYT
jgi:hypothetical protein